MTQIKRLSQEIDELVANNNVKLLEHERERNEALKEIGNLLHDSCIVSNNEVMYAWCLLTCKWKFNTQLSRQSSCLFPSYLVFPLLPFDVAVILSIVLSFHFYLLCSSMIKFCIIFPIQPFDVAA